MKRSVTTRLPNGMTIEDLQTSLDLDSNSHITLAVPRTLKGEGCDYTYYQSVCSCGWSGEYKASKLTAQEDRCPNRSSLKDSDAYKEAERLINQKGHK